MSKVAATGMGLLILFFTQQGEDEKLAKRADQLTAKLVKNLEELAKKYDGLNDPEATHLLASCALDLEARTPSSRRSRAVAR